ncbi:hypothetical protein A6R68_23027, partial [Neotoma lepida]
MKIHQSLEQPEEKIRPWDKKQHSEAVWAMLTEQREFIFVKCIGYHRQEIIGQVTQNIYRRPVAVAWCHHNIHFLEGEGSVHCSWSLGPPMSVSAGRHSSSSQYNLDCGSDKRSKNTKLNVKKIPEFSEADMKLSEEIQSNASQVQGYSEGCQHQDSADRQQGIHQSVHSRERPFKCSECGKGFGRRSHLAGHLRLHSREKSHQCHECGEIFFQYVSLLEHQVLHVGQKSEKN